MQILREHLDIEARENNLKPNTRQKHEFQFNNIARFLHANGLQIAPPADIRPRHMDELKEWLFKNTPTRTHTHIARHLRLCREAMNLAVRREILPYNCLLSMKLKKDKEKTVVSLSTYEVQRFEQYKPKYEFAALCRDLFLFQCYTGLSYCDLWRFVLQNDKIGKKKIVWITAERGKTGKPFWAIFSKEAEKIWKYYGSEFPEIRVQSYNRTLRKIAKSLGLKKHLTTHVARKTFATDMRNKGYSIPAISAMLGNTEVVARKYYIEQTRELVKIEFLRVAA